MHVELVDMLLPVAEALGALLRSRRGRANLWDVLLELARERAGTEAERERRATVAEPDWLRHDRPKVAIGLRMAGSVLRTVLNTGRRAPQQDADASHCPDPPEWPTPP